MSTTEPITAEFVAEQIKIQNTNKRLIEAYDPFEKNNWNFHDPIKVYGEALTLEAYNILHKEALGKLEQDLSEIENKVIPNIKRDIEMLKLEIAHYEHNRQ